MADRETTVRQSLLDRLTDENPKRLTDPSMSLAESVDRFKAGVLEDLQWLLNTTRARVVDSRSGRLGDVSPERFPEVSASVFTFGVPDVVSLDADSPGDRRRLARAVEQAISIHEPRLRGVRVRPADDELKPDEPKPAQPASKGDPRFQVRLQIQADLCLELGPERLVLDTVLEVSSGQIRVGGAP